MSHAARWAVPFIHGIRPSHWKFWRQKTTSPSNWMKLVCAISTWRIQRILQCSAFIVMVMKFAANLIRRKGNLIRGYRTDSRIVRSQFHFVVFFLVSRSMAPLWVALRRWNYCITQCNGMARTRWACRKPIRKSISDFYALQCAQLSRSRMWTLSRAINRSSTRGRFTLPMKIMHRHQAVVSFGWRIKFANIYTQDFFSVPRINKLVANARASTLCAHIYAPPITIQGERNKLNPFRWNWT